MGKLFFYNGNILTMNEKKSVQSVVVENNNITFCGDYDKGLEYIDDNTRHIDLKGKTLLPGFNDSHMHLLSYSMTKHKVDLSDCKSIKEVQSKIKEFAKKEKDGIFGDWILGHGWNHENFEEKRLLTKEDIDEVVNDRPVFLARACYHICAVNSKALARVKIDKNTKAPEGGKIDKSKVTGEPTGILRENGLYLAYTNIPITDDVEKIKELITSAIEDANKVGITSIQTDDFSHIKNYKNIIKAYEELNNENKLNARMNLQMLFPNLEELKSFLQTGVTTGDGDEFLKYGPLKVLGDGSLGSRTAALEKPYNDDETTDGVLIQTDDELEEILKTAYNSGLQLAVHAIGDRCMNQVLDTYIKLNKENPKEDPRFRIIHSQICSEEIYNKYLEVDAIADIQPIFMKTDMYMAEDRIGSERMKTSYCWKTMLDKGIKLSGSSDAPVESFNPLWGIYSAITRKDLEGNPKSGWYKEERLDLYETLELFTKNSAYSTYEEDIKGMIKEGMLADLVILSEDITHIEVDNIKNIDVEMTIVDGEIVYKRK